MIEHTLRIVYSLIFWGGICLAAEAQADLCLMNRFEQRFATLDSLIFVPVPSCDTPPTPAETRLYSQHLETADQLFTSHGLRGDSLRLIRDSLLDEKYRREQAVFQAKTGLQLTGQTYVRLDKDFGVDEEDALSRYRAKIQAEIRWYFFQSSLFNRKGVLAEQRLRQEVEKKKLNRTELSHAVPAQQEGYRHCYDSLLAHIVRHRVQNLTLLSDAQTYLLDRQQIASDELLKLLDEKAQAERLLATLPTLLPDTHTSQPLAGWLIEIDSLRFLQEIRENHTELALNRLESELLEQQRKNTRYWNDFRLAPFVRYSFYERSHHHANSSNVDAGLSFTIPLHNEAGQQRRLLAAQQKAHQLQGALLRDQVEQDIRCRLERLRQSNLLVRGEYERLIRLKQYLERRKEAYLKGRGEYSRPARLKEYNTYLSCWESLVRYQYRRDLELAELSAFIGHRSILPFCRIQILR